MSRAKKIKTRILDLLEYGFKKIIDFRFRKRTVSGVLLKIVTLSLITELVESASIIPPEVLNPLFDIFRNNIVNPYDAVLVAICKYYFIGINEGLSMLSICSKLYLITLFTILEWRKENNKDWNWTLVLFWNWNWNILVNVDVELNLVKIGNEFWKPNKKWFKSIKQCYAEELHNNKYIQELHVRSNLEMGIIDHLNETIPLKTSKSYISSARNGIVQLGNELDNLFKQIRHPKSDYEFNEESQYYDELQELRALVEPSLEAVQKLERSVILGENKEVLEYNTPDLSVLSFTLGDIERSFKDDAFELLLHKEDGLYDTQLILKLFNPVISIKEELLDRFAKVETLIDNLIRNVFIVDAKAGMGKTHFSLNIIESLNGQFPIFIKASQFSGNTISIHHGFKKILNLPDTICQDNFLQSLQDFGKRQKQKVVLVIDGLNETTNHVNGFSSIWSDGLPEFIESVKRYSHLALIVTCRTSYLEQLGVINSPYRYQLSGFEDHDARVEAVAKYFDYYKIKVKNIEKIDNSFFEIPLVLNIFCRSQNPLRENVKKVALEHETYDQILHDFINSESISIACKQERPTNTPILDAINRNSDAFLKHDNAALAYDDFLSITDAKSLDNIFIKTSIAYELLQSELIFMKEMLLGHKEEKVVHTFQNIGGYLLANALIKKYSSARLLVKSDFFVKKLANFNKGNNNHQLTTDIIKFLVIAFARKKDDLINYTEDQLVVDYTWDFIFENPKAEETSELTYRIQEFLKNKSGWNGLLKRSFESLLDPRALFNISYILQELKKADNFLVDITWTKLIYTEFDAFDNLINDIRTESSTQDKVDIEVFNLDDSKKLVLELIIGVLESTIIELRDKASYILLEFGIIYPSYFFDKLFEFSSTNRLYIYERLASIAYGICLRKQNEEDFINGVFKSIVPKLYELQFGPDPVSPSYHYVVIDSLKHIVDLAIHKGIFDLKEDEKELFNQYQFIPAEEWSHITKEDLDKVKPIVASWHNKRPDPLGKDFVTYTIPRLIADFNENREFQIEATAQIYRRALHSGYLPEEDFEADNELEKHFYHGYDIQYPRKKVDRLGKKYSWNAFYEYAGYLLKNNKLDVWYKGDSDIQSHYKRLSDIELESSFPVPKIVEEQLFRKDLLAHKSEDPAWTEKEVYDLSRNVWEYKFAETDFTLLKGQLIQKVDNSYDVESYLLIDAYLVKKENIKGKIDVIIDRNFDWNENFHGSGGYMYQTYFGELYWADTISKVNFAHESLSTGNKRLKEITLSFQDILFKEEFKENNFGDRVKIEVDEQIVLEVLPAWMEYSWESDSNVYPSLRDIIPVSNLGKYLGLKSDPKNLQLLDEKGSLACKTVKFKHEGMIEQSLNYLRTDLLMKYLDDHDLTLMYQIKQHTYDRKAGDGNGDFRGMQFFFPYLNDK